ncbi:hypothetical protein BU15DRAFT_44362 [Melanogaster broomeanus]|nr:hypothetical protein BU15DRAFT_44362 [Melanogaster broomeanus]
MVLKYGDGRGDIPISHWHYENVHQPRLGPGSRPRPHTAYHPHDRSRSAADAYPPPPHSRNYDHGGPHYHSTRHAPRRMQEDDFSTPPEDIHILPAAPNAQPHRPKGTYRPRRASEPFHHDPLHSSSLDDPEEIIIEPPQIPTNVDMPPPIVYSHSQHIHDPYDHHHPSHSHSRGNRPPPSIVYAPGYHSDHYAPPTIVYAPQKAPGMTYTVSAPTGSGFPQYPRITANPYPSVHSNLESVYEEPRYGPRGPRPREDVISHPVSEAASGDSGSTYYVIPTPGQKVKVLVGTEASLYTATSTTKSASSPHSLHSGAGGGGFKKPLFRRLISFASDLSRSSRGSRSSMKILQRRHSIDPSARARSQER